MDLLCSYRAYFTQPRVPTEQGVAGVLLSNHGGRQLDFARSAIEVLPEVMAALKDINYDPTKFEVFIDGGIRRGSDIFKAMALGKLHEPIHTLPANREESTRHSGGVS